jgi:hypothetical protein
MMPGWSPFPGNINQLVIKLDSYVHQLAKTGARADGGALRPLFGVGVCHAAVCCVLVSRAACACCKALASCVPAPHTQPQAGGTIGEFVNPKYKDATKTAFKSSTRLECMMQASAKGKPNTVAGGQLQDSA